MRPSFIVIILYYYSCFENTIETIKTQWLIQIKCILIKTYSDLSKKISNKDTYLSKKDCWLTAWAIL